MTGEGFLSRDHKYIISTALVFYQHAPDSVLQWIRHRYERFVNALSATSAIVLGVLVGLVFLRGPELPKQLAFDGILLAVAAATMVWAFEARRLAREMEAFWYKVNGYDV